MIKGCGPPRKPIRMCLVIVGTSIGEQSLKTIVGPVAYALSPITLYNSLRLSLKACR